MLLTRRRRRVAVAALAVDQLVAWGVLYYAYAVLAAPLAAEVGLPRWQVAAAFSLGLLVAGRGSHALGPLLDARGTRGAMRLGALAAPLVFAGIALVGGVASVVAAFVLLGAVQALALYEPAFRTVVDWYPDERGRARAMLALTSVGGFASTVFLPVTAALVAALGWRATVVVLAAILASVLVPARMLMPLPQRGPGQRRDDTGDHPRSRSLLAAGLAMHALASTGVFLGLTWHLIERGQSAASAAAIAGLAGAAQVPGRLVSGPLRRLVGGAGFLPALLLVQAAALLGAVTAGGAAATLWVMVFGAAGGMMTLERATVLVEWYGRDQFGAHQGRLAAATSVARAASPFAVEAGHQLARYDAVFAVLAGVLALAAWTCRRAATARQAERATCA